MKYNVRNEHRLDSLDQASYEQVLQRLRKDLLAGDTAALPPTSEPHGT